MGKKTLINQLILIQIQKIVHVCYDVQFFFFTNIGCGTGKYLSTNPHVFKVGVDRCQRLTEIARSQDSEVSV